MLIQTRSRTKPSPTELRALLRQAARENLWRQGELSWKLHPSQSGVYEQMQASKASRYVLEIARRWGKTWLLGVLAMETCLRNPGCRVVYGASTLKALEEFILPQFEALIEDAPADCTPVWNSGSGHWTFPNGSYIHLFGADDKRKANRGRGPAAALAIFDEAGFTPVLKYVLKSIFRPQLLTTGGRTFVASTPAEEPDHDFTEIAERAEANGNYARRTIYDNPRLTQQRIIDFIAEDAKEDGLSPEAYVETDTFRREYLAERVIDHLLVVVPEWDHKRSTLIQAVPRPEYFDGMSVLDPGGADPHAVTFGYWHFGLAKWVVEDELLLRDGEHSGELVAAIKAKERELWGVERFDGSLRAGREQPSQELLAQLPDFMSAVLVKDAQEQPFVRWADNANVTLVRDLYLLHGLAFVPTRKDDLQAQVNNLRVMVNAEELLLHPRCVHTDRHLRATTWENHKRKRFTRKAGEHGDCLATLIYGARNLDRQRNPVPEHMRPPPTRRELVRGTGHSDLERAMLGNSPLGRKLLAGRRG